jgi:integrase
MREPKRKPIHLLDHLTIRHAAIPEGRRELWLNDGGGLFVRKRENAAGIAKVDFVYRYGNRAETLDAPTLATARKLAAELRPERRGLGNPIERRRDEVQRVRSAEEAARRAREEAELRDRLAATSDTLFEAWIAGYAARELKPRTLLDHRAVWRQHVSPAIGAMKVEHVRAVDLTNIVTPLLSAGTARTAVKVHQLTKQVFAWAVERGALAGSPFAAMRKAPAKPRKRTRHLTFEELRVLLSERLPAANIGPVMHAVVRLILATGCRPGEILGARWAWIDRHEQRLTLPAETTKNGREHEIPLSDYARGAIARLREIRRGEWLCPMPTDASRPLPVLRLDRVVGDRQRPPGAKRGRDRDRTRLQARLFVLQGNETSGTWRPHDLRRTAASRLSELNVPPYTIEALLNHAPATLQATYQQYDRMPERRAALDIWGAILARLEAGEHVSGPSEKAAPDTGNVVQLRSGTHG